MYNTRGRAPHIFTQLELSALALYPALSLSTIGKMLGISKSGVRYWLVSRFPDAVKKAMDADVPEYDVNGARCTRCGILIAATVLGANGECQPCNMEREYRARMQAGEARVPWYVVQMPEMVLEVRA